MSRESIIEELNLVSSLLQDIKFRDDNKNGLNDLLRMENVIKYFINKRILSLSFMNFGENKLEKAEQLVKMIDNIKTDNTKKLEVFNCIINYLTSLNISVNIEGESCNLAIDKVLYNKGMLCNESRNKIYTDGNFKYDLYRDTQHIKCENDAQYLMNIAISKKNNDIVKPHSSIFIRDFNLILPSLKEIQSAGFPKMTPVDGNFISMNDVKNIKFRELYESVNLEDYKTLVKK